MKTKKCSKCKENKDASCFMKCKANKSGLYSSCKACNKERIRIYNIKNKENVIKTYKKYYEKNKKEILKKSVIKNRKYKKEFEGIKKIPKIQRRIT